MFYSVTYRQAYRVNSACLTGILEASNCEQAKRLATLAVPAGYTVVKVSKRGGQNPLNQACKIMKKLERIADAIGYDIDSDPRWIEANALVVAFDCGERLFDNSFKSELGQLVMAVNKSVYPEYDVIVEYAKDH